MGNVRELQFFGRERWGNWLRGHWSMDNGHFVMTMLGVRSLGNWGHLCQGFGAQRNWLICGLFSL
ncbi:hypothetical protein MB14_11260 [Roseivirga ehrenbergii]|uniref:Uncharacterized protein n=1 Tax=Roseivirga ehrenbergii (strain DSM 102268 / JCM 13514 / KCTC 12282 / NCIMB 14502 / KMM 6017) TaxID=279360 RepID=A0A150WXZ1_ROSEK|nr:hypothetical protein MB14_11260 [Roseivirga ehrenbergii]